MAGTPASLVMGPGWPGLVGVSGGRFSAEAKDFFARLSTPPTYQEKRAYDVIFRALKNSGASAELDFFHWLAAPNAQAASLNLLSTSYTLTANNAPTFTKYQGYTGNGTNASLDTGLNPATAGGLTTQDDACLGVFVLNVGTTTGAVIGRNVNPNYSFIRPYTTAGRNLVTINGGSAGVSAAVKYGTGLFVATRPDASNVSLYRNGALVQTIASTSVGLPNGIIRYLTGDGTFTDGQISAGFGGASLSAGQIAVINNAILSALAILGQAVDDPVTPYGIWRGTYDVGGNAKAGLVAIAARDVMLYGASYYFCFSGFTTGAGDSTPDLDTTHWEVLPIFDQVSLFEDDFETGAGAFNGRAVDALTWRTTGAGQSSAIVVADGADGYATSSGNTYYVMSALPQPPTEWGAIELDGASPQFTFAIGGTGVQDSIFDEMVHISFTGSNVSGLYWHDVDVAATLSSVAKYLNAASITLADGVKYECKVQIRGKFAFGFLDGALVYTVCADVIETICAAADEVYIQNQTGLALGEQRHYSAWVKRAA